MRRAGIVVTSRPPRYRVEKVPLADGPVQEIPVARKKGIDLRLGLDVVRMARNGELGVVLIFSQDQDLAEIALEVRDIARTAGSWPKVVSARSACDGDTGNRPYGLVADGPEFLRRVSRSEGLSAG